MKTDPLASMRCWAIGVVLGGREYTIPASPAVSWWPLLAEPSGAALLDMIKDPDLTDRLWQGEIETQEITEAVIETIETVTGRSFPAAYLIAGIADQHWASINGQLVRDGVRWDVLPVGAILDAIHVLLLERFGESKNEKTGLRWVDEYLAALDAPRPGTGSRVSEQAISDFETMAGPRPTRSGGVTAPPELSSDAPSVGTPSRTRTPSRPPRRPGQSGAPTTPPSTPGRSDPAARNAPPPAGASPTS